MIARTFAVVGLSALVLAGCAYESSPTVPEATDLSAKTSMVYVDESLGITCTRLSGGEFSWGGCYASNRATLPVTEETQAVNLFMKAATIKIDNDAGLVCLRFSSGKFGWGSCLPLADLTPEAREDLREAAALRG